MNSNISDAAEFEIPAKHNYFYFFIRTANHFLVISSIVLFVSHHMPHKGFNFAAAVALLFSCLCFFARRYRKHREEHTQCKEKSSYSKTSIILLFITIPLIMWPLYDDFRYRKNPSTSATGKYKAAITLSPYSYFDFCIYNESGKLLHHDPTNLYGYNGACWKWDSNDRFWIYKKWGEEYYYLEQTDNKWVKKDWTPPAKGSRKIPEISPPADLRP